MKNITKIANVVVLATLLGLSVYNYDKISSLENEVRGIKIEQHRNSEDLNRVYTKFQDTDNNLNRLIKEKVFFYEILMAKKILSKKLKIEEDRIHFDDLKLSVTWEEVTGIELMISWACDVDMYSCASFIVDIETWVISKF